MSEKDNLQEADGVKEEIKPQNKEVTVEIETETVLKESTEKKSEIEETTVAENTEVALDEIDASNAEDAEDESNSKRHEIEEKDYHTMSLTALVDELENLVKNEKIQTIKSHFETIKTEFNAKFSTLIEEKKEEFLAAGGNAIDFHFKNLEKTRFNDIYREYRDKRQAYYKNLEQNLKTNLEQRLEIIEEIKGLINVEEKHKHHLQAF